MVERQLHWSVDIGNIEPPTAGGRAGFLSAMTKCASTTKAVNMMRASFFAAGLFVALWGASFLLVDKLVLHLKDDSTREAGVRGMFMSITPTKQKVFDPPDWAAFSLMSVGAVTMLYAVALPKKQG